MQYLHLTMNPNQMEDNWFRFALSEEVSFVEFDSNYGCNQNLNDNPLKNYAAK